MPPLAKPAEPPGEAVNIEILALTYGAIVRQLLADLEDVSVVNAKLKQMGKNIGTRLIEEYLAKSRQTRCVSFQDTARSIAEVAFPMFLGVRGEVAPVGDGKAECTIRLREIPLADFVEIPDDLRGLRYCNLVTGVVEGALDRVNMRVTCNLVKDMLAGDPEYELQLMLESAGNEAYPFGEDD